MAYIDTKNPVVRKLVLANLVDMNAEVQRDPKFRVLGKQWYPQEGDNARADAQRVFGGSVPHLRTGEGIVSAVSPAMPWGRNAQAISELSELSDSDWSKIHEDVQSGGARTADVKRIMANTSIPAATSSQLVKAHAMLRGADPQEVLSRSSNPKTHSFMENLGGNTEYVTIDYRAHDIAANRFIGARDTKRGIGSALLATPGRTTRYEDLEQLHHEAARAINEMFGLTGGPHEVAGMDVQAGNWVLGKHIETHRWPTKTGKPRKTGVPRTGQQYLEDRPDVETQAAASVGTAQGQASPEEPVPVVGRSRQARRGGRAQRTP